MTLKDFVVPKLRTQKTLSDKCPKSLVLEDPSARNMVTFQKHCFNLRHTIFIIFIGNCLGK